MWSTEGNAYLLKLKWGSPHRLVNHATYLGYLHADASGFMIVKCSESATKGRRRAHFGSPLFDNFPRIKIFLVGNDAEPKAPARNRDVLFETGINAIGVARS